MIWKQSSYIAQSNPERARTFGYELIDRALSIATFPERGRVVPEIKEAAVREIIHGSYRIIYETISGGEIVFVLRFWHAARGEPEIVSES
jgi:plasmid stabilization system protein ParE